MRGTALLHLRGSTTPSTIPNGLGPSARPWSACRNTGGPAGMHDPARALLPRVGRGRALRDRRDPPWGSSHRAMVGGNVSDAEQRATEDQIRRALGDDRSTELRTRGAAMDIDDALSVALAELDRDRGSLISSAGWVPSCRHGAPYRRPRTRCPRTDRRTERSHDRQAERTRTAHSVRSSLARSTRPDRVREDPVMADRDLFLHEFIDINGMHQWDYMEHTRSSSRVTRRSSSSCSARGTRWASPPGGPRS